MEPVTLGEAVWKKIKPWVSVGPFFLLPALRKEPADVQVHREGTRACGGLESERFACFKNCFVNF